MANAGMVRIVCRNGQILRARDLIINKSTLLILSGLAVAVSLMARENSRCAS